MEGSPGWPVSTLVIGAVPPNIFKLEIAVNTMFTISMTHQITRAPTTAVAIDWRVCIIGKFLKTPC